ncbi:MAG: T9SS type A sorting domain-containing protein [Candidatus Cloacimonadaceae bacterium]|nr:T9SS type A sorting domain-containing protein [Candidatus Cloacimonadota bacterium]MDX9949164.1 T9SS type A sorting domain-containing protein [Candidatus Syntrophosphaera sp.]NLN84919.1 T9SS type A sorting domain-containing protein [Candidatus Cloacimonadota bacterium]
MRVFLAVVLALFAVSAMALDFVPGSGMQVCPDQGREYSFAYHTGSDDLNLFGSDTWAVRFNFSEVYPQTYASQFEVTKALLWLPQTGDSVRVALFSESHGSPGVSLASAAALVSSNSVEIPFSNSVVADTLWLLVNYATNFSNRFVSASMGGGSHSYFWNTSFSNPFFQSFGTAGFNAELLFGLGGDFVLSTPDLELEEFELEGELQPRQRVYPTFTIYNHSDLTVHDAKMEITGRSPSPQFAPSFIINIPEPISPRSRFVFDSQSPGYEDAGIDLPDQPAQLRLKAALSSVSVGETYTTNNEIRLNRFSFQEEYPLFLTESFMRTDASMQITVSQDQHEFPNIHRLNYFPILTDSLSNIAAQIRFNWYGFNSLPRTALNGNLRINGFSTDYADSYQQHCQDLQNSKSLISSSRCDFTHVPQNDMVSVALTFRNENTLLYATASEYNLIGDTRLCVGLFKKHNFDGAERWVIERWIRHGAALEGPLGQGEQLDVNFNISLSNLSLADLAQDYRLYYWLQLKGGGQILYSSFADFTEVVSVQDELLPLPRLQVSPNPLRGQASLRIGLDGAQKLGKVRIFNLRGQLIFEIAGQVDEISLKAMDFPASGIYLLRAELPDPKGGNFWLERKITIIK